MREETVVEVTLDKIGDCNQNRKKQKTENVRSHTRNRLI
jgi:hypothetical protein